MPVIHREIGGGMSGQTPSARQALNSDSLKDNGKHNRHHSKRKNRQADFGIDFQHDQAPGLPLRAQHAQEVCCENRRRAGKLEPSKDEQSEKREAQPQPGNVALVDHELAVPGSASATSLGRFKRSMSLP